MSDMHPPRNLAGWVARFALGAIPVLRQTARRLDEARRRSDRLSGREITEIVLDDPLLALRVLATIQSLGSKQLRHDITTISSAVMLLGVEPFFRTFQQLPTVEAVMSGQPQALLGMLQGIRRSQRACRYAHDWALFRHDMNIEEVALAALLHNVTELLLWCFAPEAALEIRSRRQRDGRLPSGEDEQAVLGLSLAELQVALCQTWRLPPLLTRMMDDRQSETPRQQNVQLAAQLVRHSADGWTDAALAADFAAIQGLLHIDRATLLSRLQVPEELLGAALKE